MCKKVCEFVLIFASLCFYVFANIKPSAWKFRPPLVWGNVLDIFVTHRWVPFCLLCGTLWSGWLPIHSVIIRIQRFVTSIFKWHLRSLSLHLFHKSNNAWRFSLFFLLRFARFSAGITEGHGVPGISDCPSPMWGIFWGYFLQAQFGNFCFENSHLMLPLRSPILGGGHTSSVWPPFFWVFF